MDYVSERIANISALETDIKRAYDMVEMLRSEVKKENSSISKINELLKPLQLTLLQAKDFEFIIECRRVHPLMEDSRASHIAGKSVKNGHD